MMKRRVSSASQFSKVCFKPCYDREQKEAQQKHGSDLMTALLSPISLSPIVTILGCQLMAYLVWVFDKRKRYKVCDDGLSET